MGSFTEMVVRNGIKSKIVRRKNAEDRKDKTYTIRLTEEDFYNYEQCAINEHIALAEFIRLAIEKGVAKKIKEMNLNKNK